MFQRYLPIKKLETIFIFWCLVITWITKEFPTRPTSMMKPKKVGTSQALTSTGGPWPVRVADLLHTDTHSGPWSESDSTIIFTHQSQWYFCNKYRTYQCIILNIKAECKLTSNKQDVNENYQLQFRWFNKSIRWHVLTFEILLYICIHF